MDGQPRMGNPFEWFSRRLDKQGVLPADMSAKAKEEARTALGISKGAIPGVSMIRKDKGGIFPTWRHLGHL